MRKANMNNNQIYPFERNRYYPGKMLTSADFQAEQNYFNNKRRFLNNMMYGAGIICGCGVFSLDDLSLLVESGAAIDGLGREIVIESSVVKKLSSIEGFDQLKTNLASLCLRYQEKDVHTVYALNSQNADKEYEYNRISEEYQLFLMDSVDAGNGFELESEFLVKGTLVETEDYLVEVILPATVCRGRQVRMLAKVQKLSADKKTFSYHGVLQTPAFRSPDGGHEVEIAFEDIALEQGETVTKEYWMTVQDVSLVDTDVVLKSDSASAAVNGTEEPVMSALSLKVMIGDLTPRELVNREIGRVSLEMQSMGGVQDFIRLADLKLVRTDSAYLIEEVIENHVKKYIASPAQHAKRHEYLSYFLREDESEIAQEDGRTENIRVENAGRDMSAEPQIATGTLEIPLGNAAKKGDICYSGEIIHGLGKGNVYVDIGYEYIAEDTALGVGAKNTIFGNPKLFENTARTDVNVETAVKVMNDKGSFTVAAKLLQNVDYLVLTYRWVAMKFPAGNNLGLKEDYSDRSITAVTPTVVLGAKESYYFEVKCTNMDSYTIAYELTEPGSGEITAEGVYTAPGKEGVYEIRIYCVDMPVICTYAYAIVKKKTAEDADKK